MGDDSKLQKNTDHMPPRASIARIFSDLLQQAWLIPTESMVCLLAISLKIYYLLKLAIHNTKLRPGMGANSYCKS